jgi:hypothetical protein
VVVIRDLGVSVRVVGDSDLEVAQVQDGREGGEDTGLPRVPRAHDSRDEPIMCDHVSGCRLIARCDAGLSQTKYTVLSRLGIPEADHDEPATPRGLHRPGARTSKSRIHCHAGLRVRTWKKKRERYEIKRARSLESSRRPRPPRPRTNRDERARTRAHTHTRGHSPTHSLTHKQIHTNTHTRTHTRPWQ